MLKRGKMDRDLVEFVVIDQLVPKEHLLRKIDAAGRASRSCMKWWSHSIVRIMDAPASVEPGVNLRSGRRCTGFYGVGYVLILPPPLRPLWAFWCVVRGYGCICSRFTFASCSRCPWGMFY